MARWVAELPGHGATPDDYEAILAPLYAWMYALAQRSHDGVIRAGARSSARAWVALAGEGRRERPLRAAALGAGYVALVKTFNLAGVGPVRHDLSGASLRQGGLSGVAEVVERLRIGARHVIFGHTHRSGPWPGDDLSEWSSPAGVNLVNTGCWVYQRHFLTPTPNASPYWPGVAALVDEDAAQFPRLLRLLGDRPLEQIAPEAAAIPSEALA
jgi:hypothetical protein